MIKNYFKIALRNLSKQKLYSTINISGLSIALAVTVFGLLFVSQELSFDQFHEDEERIYRINTVFGEGMRQQGSLSESPSILKPTLVDQVPEIEAMTRIKAFELPLKNGNKSFNERVFFVENEYFDIFSFAMVGGSKEDLLKSPNHLVLSKQMADKYFGDQNPIGETLSIFYRSSFHDFTVTGVIENSPANSSIQHDFLISYQWLINIDPEEYDLNGWAPNVFNFVSLNPSAGSVTEVNQKLANIIEIARGAFLEERGFPRNSVSYELQPLKDLHLSSEVRNWPNTVLLGPSPSNIMYSYILISIVFVILLIACINYTTYSIGYSIYRGKEVGVRKTLGAGRNQIMLQFWLETLILTFIAFCIGFALLQLLLPFLNISLGLNLSLDVISTPVNLLYMAAIWLLVSLLAGSYPSLIISGFKPQQVLKGRVKAQAGDNLSRFLVGIQYVGVLILIISLVTIFKQLNLIQAKSFGDENKQVLIIQNQQSNGISYVNSYNRLKTQLETKGNYQITASFGAVNDDLFMMGYTKNSEEADPFFARAFIVDDNYLDIYEDLELKNGRFFEEARSTDQNRAIVVNETFVQQMGITEPLGNLLQTSATMIHEQGEVEIIGVVKDFHFESLHKSIGPAVFIPLRNNIATRYISIQFPASEAAETVDNARTAWAEVHAGLPFEYSFLDQRYEAFYTSEIRWKNIISYATVLGILISVMGILALTGLSANNQRKEIGIRKILGATVSNILVLLGKQFILSLFVAFLIAIPVAHYLMSQWLQNFSYATEIGILPYIIAGGITFVVTIFAFGQQALQAATGSPVEALRSE